MPPAVQQFDLGVRVRELLLRRLFGQQDFPQLHLPPGLDRHRALQLREGQLHVEGVRRGFNSDCDYR